MNKKSEKINVAILLLLLALQLSCHHQTTADQHIKIASWNIYWLGQHEFNNRSVQDYQRLAEYARQLNADIIALQEIENEYFARLVFGDQYRYFFSDRPGGPGTQRVGFAVRANKNIEVLDIQVVQSLDIDNLRYGMEILLNVHDQRLRILTVHLKSGCFDQPLSQQALARIDDNQLINHCERLKLQIEPLETWIDQRLADESPSESGPVLPTAYIILGDFNRRLALEKQMNYQEEEGIWPALNDPDEPSQRLHLVNEHHQPLCWQGRFEQFVDYIIANDAAMNFINPSSFTELIYQETDYPAYHPLISDHCPLAIQYQI